MEHTPGTEPRPSHTPAEKRVENLNSKTDQFPKIFEHLVSIQMQRADTESPTKKLATEAT